MKKAIATLDRFLKGWKAQNYLKMYKYSQVTWKSVKTSNDIKQMFNGLKVDGYTIGNSIEVSKSAYQINVHVKLNGKWKYPDKVNVICESGPYKPSEKGVWGVNPVSVLKTVKPS